MTNETTALHRKLFKHNEKKDKIFGPNGNVTGYLHRTGVSSPVIFTSKDVMLTIGVPDPRRYNGCEE